MTVTDYVPHGIVIAFTGVVSYIFREHTKQDDARFSRIETALTTIEAQQVASAQTMADNHSEILKLFISAGLQREANAAIAAAAAER